MKKKVLSVLLVGAMTASLFAGCGSNAGETTGAAGGDAATTEEGGADADVAQNPQED